MQTKYIHNYYREQKKHVKSIINPDCTDKSVMTILSGSSFVLKQFKT